MTEELSDEEKFYHEWVKNNLDYINQHKNSIEVMKRLYLTGFSDGFTYQRKLRAEEELQK
jgi:hypothetical protein